ncbi:MAG TPA: Wzz/FepE/Etk N-terminal domain-containing protein, partial [Rhizomicrobium sp.]|nr:Wzz/FepE/Etk N-terminal domain-containing protein [Rhizomicrobium sp.]
MPDILDDAPSTSSMSRMFSVAQLWSDFCAYFLLLVFLIVVGLSAVIAYTLLAKPSYTATAIVGPADNSDQPFGDSMAGGLSGIGGIAKHLHVGGALGGAGDDETFDEYTSLLTSNRLAERLVRKDHILPEFFPDAWDPVYDRWRPRDDFVSRNVDYLKVLLRRPLKPAPDVEDLEKYFKKYLVVDPSLETSFATVTFRFHTREGAVRLLGLILREADNIIREDKR